MTETTIRYETDADGVVVLTMDDPAARVNTMNERWAASLHAVVDRLYAERDSVTGVVVTSAKKSFFAGGDLTRLVQVGPADAGAVFAEIEGIKADLRRLETLGRPVAAALNGSALGGGLEIALACHHRVAVDDSHLELGQPEVQLGLLPGAGGVARHVRRMGLADALMKVLLQGRRYKPGPAMELGLVDELVSGPAELVPTAKRWVLEHRDDPDAAIQPWDREGYRMPGGTPASPKLAQFLPAFPANLRKQTKGAPYPAPAAIMAAAVEGAQVDFETATRIESRYFVELVIGPIAKNMIQAFFFDLQAINNGGSRPSEVPPYRARKVAVLGAGMMGAGIAYQCATRGVEVVLKDVSMEAAERGKAHSATLLDKGMARGRVTAEERDEVLSRITPTDRAADVAGADLMIEAVFEDQALKRRVYGEVEPSLSADALLCSNTSTLPISELADAVSRPEAFLGMHFFSPVDKMKLVELVVGKQTSNEALARAYDVARQIGKTPVVVNDSRGFFTSRVFGTLVMEGVNMLAEGIDPQTIERAATEKGFPAPPLAMIDEISLTLAQHIRDSAIASGDSEKLGGFGEGPGMRLVDRMVKELGRRGKAAGAGFYEYPKDAPKRLWPGLWEHFVLPDRNPVEASTFRDCQERFTFAMSIETVKCVAEGVLRSTADANIGSIFGIGFPPLYGGALQYVNNYFDERPGSDLRGVAGFAARARELAAAYGDRFTPPPLLQEKAAAGEPF
ncbi:MAG TPA: 3-hydroxyacyl-CoA dehydrogenase NAD-binding domain-containing protein [Nocardioidaceae bacterium]|nr:3-hydroxyacyl-CoA dehydrogenase NAD-binding domain-containing protein [Nocardioidaceae bacterium]